MFETERQMVADAAAAQRLDQVTVRRGPAELVTDPVTLQATPAAQTTVWSGPAHCKPASAAGDVTLGESDLATRSMTVSIPPDTPRIAVNDVVSVDVAEDPDLARGSTWRVTSVGGGGFWSAYRSLFCVEQYPSNYWTAEET